MFTIQSLNPKPVTHLNLILGKGNWDASDPPSNTQLIYLMSRLGDEGHIEEMYADAVTGDVYYQKHNTYNPYRGTWFKLRRDNA